jgi:hypothetical protein
MEPATRIDPAVNGEERAYRKGLKEGIERGLRGGFERGVRTTLLEVLHVRGIALNALERRQIAAESSASRLRQWVRRALTARSAGEVFVHTS